MMQVSDQIIKEVNTWRSKPMSNLNYSTDGGKGGQDHLEAVQGIDQSC